jgi:hypothetical protein
MITGGTVLVIVILSSFYEGPQDILCHHDEDHAGHKTVYGIEFRPSLPGKVGMLMHKKLDNKEDQEGYIKTAEEDLHIPGFVKQVGFEWFI